MPSERERRETLDSLSLNLRHLTQHSYLSHLADDVVDESKSISMDPDMCFRISVHCQRHARIQNVDNERSAVSMCQHYLSTIHHSYGLECPHLSNSLSKPGIVSSGQFPALHYQLRIVYLHSVSECVFHDRHGVYNHDCYRRNTITVG